MPGVTGSSAEQPHKPGPGPDRRPWIVLPLLVLAAYASGLGNTWVEWDDFFFLRDNPALHSPAGIAGIWTPGADPLRKFYPLTYTLHWLAFRVWGAWPTGHLLVALLLHGLNSAAVYALVRAFGGSARAGWIAGALFAVHPMHVAAVAWLASLKNVLSTTFALLAILAYLRFARQAAASGQAATRGYGASHAALRWYLAALAALTAALLSKSATITVPFSLLLADRLVVGRRGWRTIWPILPMLAVAIGLAAITAHEEWNVEARRYAEPLPERPLAAAGALWFYLGKFFWPLDLRTIYPRWEVSWSPLWIAALVAALASAALVFAARRQLGGTTVWGCAHFAISLGPVLGLLEFGYLYRSPVSDHFVYLASVGVLMIVGLYADRVLAALERLRPAASRALSAVVVVIVAGLGLKTWHQVQVWRDAVSFWSFTVAGNPSDLFAREQLALALERAGRLQESAGVWQELIEADPNQPRNHVNLGSALYRLGRGGEAMRAFQTALSLDPDFAPAHYNIAYLLATQDRAAAALPFASEAVRLNPQDWEAQALLAELCLKVGDLDRAVEHSLTVGELQKDNPAVQLAVAHVLTRAGRFAEALAAARRAVQLDANHLEAAAELAWLLATMPDPARRRPTEALELALRACRQADFRSAPALLALAAAHAAEGRFDHAVELGRRAVELARAAGDRAVLARAEQAMVYFARGQPVPGP
jgi:tetratricopeptide (TPR) repeat protein